MRDHTMTTGITTGMTEALVCHWVAVTDESGRTHMEAHWSSPAMAAHATHAA